MSMLPPVLPIVLGVVALLVRGAIGVAGPRSADPVRQVRGRLWLGLGSFGAVLLGTAAWTTAAPELLGLPIVVGPGAAAAVGVLAFALPPSRAASGRTRAASLRPRSARQVVGGRVLVLPAALLGVLVAVLVTTGLTADRSGEAAGRAFSVMRATVGASGGPYPGWYYGVPILVTAAILVAAVVLAVRRTVLLPAVSVDDAIDDAWRAGVGRALASIAAAGLLLYLAGVLWAADVAWGVLADTGTPGVGVLAVAQGVTSGLLLVAAVVLLALAAARVLATPRHVDVAVPA